MKPMFLAWNNYQRMFAATITDRSLVFSSYDQKSQRHLNVLSSRKIEKELEKQDRLVNKVLSDD